MTLIQTIKSKLQKYQHDGWRASVPASRNFKESGDEITARGDARPPDSTEDATIITKEMIVKDVTRRWPQTVAVFGNHRVDFCCGGAHSIEQTAKARGCTDVDALVADLNGSLAHPKAWTGDE